MTLSTSYYEFLGVEPSADAETIHRAFRRLSKDLHPDTTVLPSKEAAQKFQRLCAVYETLSNPSLRKEYDSTLVRNSSLNKPLGEDSILVSKLSSEPINSRVGVRRPLSGGELFSLLILSLTLILSLVIGLIVGLGQGRELQVWPSWMIQQPTPVNFISSLDKYVSIASFSDAPESSLSFGSRNLASTIRG